MAFIGYLIALTGSDMVNNHALSSLSKSFGEHGAYKLASSKEIVTATNTERQTFFTPNDDYINLSEAYRENPTINEVTINCDEDYTNILDALSKEEKSIPLFIEKGEGIYLIPEFEKTEEAKEGLTLSYLGKKMVFKEKV